MRFHLLRAAGTAVLLLLTLAGCSSKETPRTPGEEIPAAPSAGQHAAHAYKTVTAPSGLKLRTAPHTRATVRNLIPPGSRVRVLATAPARVSLGGRSGHWTRISWTAPGTTAPRTGWVFGGWLK